LRKYKVEWSVGADRNLEEIEKFFVYDNPALAAQTVLAILDTAEIMLNLFPLSGRPGRIKGTRELVLNNLPYIVIYSVESAVNIIRVFHTSQNFQAIRKDIEFNG